MRVAFRVDSSAELGTGHLSRCLALASALRSRGSTTTFFCRDLPGAAHERVLQLGSRLERMPADCGGGSHFRVSGEDARRTRLLMGDQIFDWLVIDHYGIDRRWQQQMKGATRRSLILDDLADRHHDADLLVDGASVPGRYGGKVGDDCKLLLGPRFALLRNEFVDIREAALDRRWQTEGRICNVVIGYGGVDQDNLTRRALDAWEAISPFDMELEVLIGEAHPARAAIEERCAATAGVECMVEAPDMASRMARADLALGAAGVMSWERCVVGLPTILTQVADNQSEIAGRVERAGAGLLLGSAKETTSTALRKALQGLCRQPARVAAMGRAAASLTDGRGVTRVIDEMLLLGGSSS